MTSASGDVVRAGGTEYEIRAEIPSVEAYRMLRPGAGLSAKTREAAELGLPNSWFSVMVFHEGAPVGLGRVVGDGGTFFMVVDICVLPEHQGRGLGKRIMQAVSDELGRRAPRSAHVGLIADGDAKYLYEKFGFVETAPASVGMAYVVGGSREDI